MSDFKDKIRLSLMEVNPSDKTQSMMKQLDFNKPLQQKISKEEEIKKWIDTHIYYSHRYVIKQDGDDYIVEPSFNSHSSEINIRCTATELTNIPFKLVNWSIVLIENSNKSTERLTINNIFGIIIKLILYNFNLDNLKLNSLNPDYLELEKCDNIENVSFPNNMTSLKISDCSLSHIPLSLKKCKIIELTIKNTNINKIENLPKGLKSLNLSYNKITTLVELPKMIKTINLSNNNLYKTTGFEIKKGVELNMSSNNFHNFKNFTLNGVTYKQMFNIFKNNPIQSTKGLLIKKVAHIFEMMKHFKNISIENLQIDIENISGEAISYDYMKNILYSNAWQFETSWVSRGYNRGVLPILVNTLSYLNGDISENDKLIKPHIGDDGYYDSVTEIKSGFDKFYDEIDTIAKEDNIELSEDVINFFFVLNKMLDFLMERYK